MGFAASQARLEAQLAAQLAESEKLLIKANIERSFRFADDVDSDQDPKGPGFNRYDFLPASKGRIGRKLHEADYVVLLNKPKRSFRR